MLNKFDQKRLDKLVAFLKENNLDLNLDIEQNSNLELTRIEIEFCNKREYIHKMAYTLKISPDNETFYEMHGFLYKESNMSLERCHTIPIFAREAYTIARKDFLSLKLIAKKFNFKMV